ncbi:GMC family oxidoreductase [candidate division KSB1 bacterium]|nr:GMC family oxidoreductase [candidate division KSB1 bacterium]NIR69172.1 GMC family oxidoreductase [candidate division KSB1 bacterium]NIS25683.1 GMC family oxidoreductase [candidate division KSB1 bacterium]NIT72551.1 GMC family oxidoreductase [candidate division KSB1 bacterium]NIU26360.1 GMC family oxidoreductase [candidate division KSB1 bacterium]
MNNKSVAIVGSGIIGATLAYLFVKKGYRVDIFEKGPDYPYPHTDQFAERIFYLYGNPAYKLPKDIKNHSITGDYQHNVELERGMLVGGSSTYWAAITPRMLPNDFRTKSLYGFGEDWPLSYDDIEPYYCKAERLLGIAGTDDDNPFAPPRSQPFPLPPFELSYDDLLLAERLTKHDIVLHTTPQARTSELYDGRDACVNFGTCDVCPIGSRYSPNHHILLAMETGLCNVHTNVSVRRIALDSSGSAKTLVYQRNDERQEKEHSANLIMVAAGAIESPRLLLLSKDSRFPDGIGNQGGHVGKHFTFHHLWHGRLQYKKKLYPGRIGPITGQSHQFMDPPTRGKHGGTKVEFASTPGFRKILTEPGSASEIFEELKAKIYSRGIIMHAESAPSPQKYITLSEKRDRFGDPYAHIHYESSEFDYETYGFATDLYDRFAAATDGEKMEFDEVNEFDNGAHHMGGTRMGTAPENSVVDEYGKIHEIPNLFVLGGSNFGGTTGAVNPTLTMVAHAIRTAEYIMDQFV